MIKCNREIYNYEQYIGYVRTDINIVPKEMNIVLDHCVKYKKRF